jgi:uncharacterized protein YndB with AHSA1/START domain
MNAITDRKGSAVVTTPSDLEIQIVRQFDHPAALLFRAYTTPELVQRWWGFGGWAWLVCEIDLRVGGDWRYVTQDGDPEGERLVVGFHGTYQEVEPPRRLVLTEVFEGMGDAMPRVDPEAAGALNTVTFEQHDGVTTMTIVVLHETQEQRDGHLEGADGVQVSMDRLDDLAADLA